MSRASTSYRTTLSRGWPGRGPAMTANQSLRRGLRETVRLELVAQRRLQDLSGRGMRNAIDEYDVIRQPPFGDLAIHVFQDVLARRGLALFELHDQQRTLVPFRVVDADHGCFGDRGMSDREIFQIDRRNPFDARSVD